jgi:hypothetical protein
VNHMPHENGRFLAGCGKTRIGIHSGAVSR